MLFIISPAKTLDFSPSPLNIQLRSAIAFPKETQALVSILKKMSAKEISEFMEVSDKIGELNYMRFQSFGKAFTPQNAKQALLAFKGEVYLGLETQKYSEAEYEFAQKHLRILSGLYGLLRPMDLIQPYRLEMGRALANKKGNNLYEFWGDKITKALKEHLEKVEGEFLVNLASQEYFKAVKSAKFKGKIINIHFQDERKGKLQTISFNAKKARGLMANEIILNKITNPQDLKAFSGNGYVFREGISTENEWFFVKPNLE
jgi:cytoplasmic iron level regulating protein YaaA (DUF328/UPF0246 family)